MYTWDFGAAGIEAPEPAHLLANAEIGLPISETVIFSATRTVEPEILEAESTIQTITVSFTLSEPLPERINSFRMGLGGHLNAYGWNTLLNRQVVSQNEVDGWFSYTDGFSAHWGVEKIEDIKVGRTYTFIARVRVNKSTGLIGNPTYLPVIMIGYAHGEDLPDETGRSVTISHPEGVVATYEVANEDVVWQPSISGPRWELNLAETLQSDGYLIAGRTLTSDGLPLSGVRLKGLPGEPLSDENGYYGVVVEAGWSGTITPEKGNLDFSPKEYSYSSISADATQQDFTSTENSQPLDTVVLTSSNNTVAITPDSPALIYGTADDNHITIESGATAQIVHFPGQNTVRIQSDATLFQVACSGSIVRFDGSDGTCFSLPATLQSQNLIFDDNRFNLCIKNGAILLGSQRITSDYTDINTIGGLEIAIDATSTTGMAPLSTSFSCSVTSGHPPYTFSWDFDDGSAVSTQQDPSHTFSNPGTYAVTVQVTDQHGFQKTESISLVVQQATTTNSCQEFTHPVSFGNTQVQIYFYSSGRSFDFTVPESQAVNSMEASYTVATLFPATVEFSVNGTVMASWTHTIDSHYSFKSVKKTFNSLQVNAGDTISLVFSGGTMSRFGGAISGEELKIQLCGTSNTPSNPPESNETHHIYAASDLGSVIKFNLSTKDTQSLNIMNETDHHPYGIATHKGTDKIYWTDYGSDKVLRANSDGSQIETVVSSGLDFPSGIAVDETHGKIYWADFGNHTIKRSNLDGTDIEVLLDDSQIVAPVGICLDIANEHLYLADEVTKKIQRVDFDGNNLQDIVINLPHPHGIAYNQGGTLFWTNWQEDTGSVQSLNLSDLEIKTISAQLNWAMGITIDPNNNKIYYSTESEIRCCNFDGTDDRFVFSYQHAPFITFD